MVYVWRVHRNYPPAREWAIGSVLQALGYVLLGGRERIPDLLSIMLGNAFLLYGIIVFNHGIARAAGRPARRWPSLVLMLFLMLFLAYFTYVQKSTGVRIVAATIAIMPSQLYAIWACLTSPLRPLRDTLRILAAWLGLAVLSWTARAIHAGSIHNILVNVQEQLQYAFYLCGEPLVASALVVLLASQRLQAELAEANQAKTTFLTTMSHELRTPLNGILGFAQILVADRTLGQRQRDGLRTIQRSGEHLLTLINDVLDLGKIEAGKLEVVPEELELEPFCRGLVDLMAVRARAKGLELVYQPGDFPERVVADPRRLRQVLLNLLGNAVKFTERGCITLTVASAPGGVRFSVQDTGVGLTTEQRALLFTPFNQFGSSAKRAEGTGLGLAISRRLVDLMGGRLEAESEAGSGARFFFTLDLPSAAGAAPEPVADDLRGFQGEPRRVLVVDDVADNRSLCRGFLEPLGFLLEEAADGPAGLTLVSSWRPDLILLDLSMAGMDGLEMLERMRAAGNAVPVLILSASAFPEDRERCRQAGCDGFLTKPLVRAELLGELARILGLTWVREESVRPDLVGRLREAAEIGDFQALQAAISELGESNPTLAGRLQALASQYELDAVVEALEGV